MEFLSNQTAVRTAALSTTEISVAAGCRPFFFLVFVFPFTQQKTRADRNPNPPARATSHPIVVVQLPDSGASRAVEQQSSDVIPTDPKV